MIDMVKFFQNLRRSWGGLFSAPITRENLSVTSGFLQILDCLVRNQGCWLSGSDIMKETSLSSGTVYPMITRMRDAGWVRKQRATDGRHVFILSDSSIVDRAKAMLAEHSHIWQAPIRG